MPKELVRAPHEVVEAVIEEVVLPAVRELAEELEQPMPVVVTQWLPHMQGPTILVGAAVPKGGEEPPPSGFMRLLFRQNYGGDRYLFHGRALYPRGFTGQKGFRGFDVDGAVQMSGAQVAEVQPGSLVVLSGTQQFRESF